MAKVQFRPHHILCTLAFQGKGYTPSFTQNYQRIHNALNDETIIEIVFHADDICMPCPMRRGQGCDQLTKINALDTQHAHILNLKSGMCLTWKEAKKRLKNQMTIPLFHEACSNCSWYPEGLCQKALQNHLDK